jgi:hypothetical protein
MRRLGIGALGLIGGALAGFVIVDLLATALVRSGGASLATGVGPLLGGLTPAAAVAGMFVALAADRRSRDRQGHD